MIKNYEYGLRYPSVNAALVTEQMRGAHRYYNQLVEIERGRRAAVSAILIAHPDTEALAARVAALVKQREEARLSIKVTRQATRDRSDTAAMRTRVKDLATELRAARQTLKTARDAIKTDAGVAAAIAAANDQAAARIRTARAACGVYWGSYLLQEQAVDAARKSKTPPHFKRWLGEGRVSVQLQGGISTVELFGDDTQVQIVPVSPDAHDRGKSRGARRLASRTVLRLRVQSTEKGRPIWAEWPMSLHRPIPEGSRIKVATVSCRRRDCSSWDWRLLLTLEIPDGVAEHARPIPRDGAVALNLGWCKRPDGAVRAGYVLSADGHVDREVVVERSTIDRVESAEAIQSQRDKNLEKMRPDLVTWLRAREADLPPWLVERTILAREPRPAPASDGAHASQPLHAPQASAASPRPRARVWHVAQWRSAARFRALAFAWRAQRFEGDEEGYQLLEKWSYRDEHLDNYASGMRRGALLDRRERYRRLAAELATRYRTLVVDDFDLRTFQQSPAPEDDRVERPAAKRNQRHAAGSELRGALLNAFGPERTNRESSVDVTRRCNDCGQVDILDRAVATREHTCSSCGATWDQDKNACKNLIDRWKTNERIGEGGPSEVARAAMSAPHKESRTERLRRTRWKNKDPEVLEAP